jgi:hypothetical protein
VTSVTIGDLGAIRGELTVDMPVTTSTPTLNLRLERPSRE